MNPQRRTRAAAGLTLLLISGLGMLIWLRSRAPGDDLPVRFAFTLPTPIIDETPTLLFEAPETTWPTAEADAETIEALYLLYVPRLDLYAPVVPVENELQTIGGQEVWQLSLPPDFAVGWSTDSAPVGTLGNTVLVGHNNEFGEVFRQLDELTEGDEIFVRTEDGDRLYHVSETALFEEEYAPLEIRLENAHWLAPTPDERLTLITCWPYFSNTHRFVVVAQPDTLSGR